MSTHEFTIRAAAFYRILGNADTVVPKDGEESFMNHLMLESKKDGASVSAIETLIGMVIEMKHVGALATFPVEDADVLGEMVLYMIHHYSTRPELPTKIAAMCGLHQIGTILTDAGPGSGSSNSRIKRTQEIAVLNKHFYDLSQLVGQSHDVKIHTEFVVPDKHLFHPDSQFIHVIINV